MNITVAKGKGWKIVLDGLSNRFFVIREGEEPVICSLFTTALRMALKLTNQNKKVAPVTDAPKISHCDSTALINGVLWRIAKFNDLFYVQTRLRKNIPWTTREGKVATTIAAFTTIEGAIFCLLETISD